MSVSTTTHLNFRGNARDALTFYRSVFGGDLVAVTYEDAHAVQDPADADRIMWGQVVGDDGFAVMAYDVPSRMTWHPGENAVFVSVRGDDQDQLRRYWDALADGATVVQPLARSGWSPLYGMLTDRFGITWVLDIAVPYGG